MANITVNVGVFDKSFQNLPNFGLIIAEINLSPTLVSELNLMPAGSIRINTGAGTTSSQDRDGNNKVTLIDPTMIPGYDGNNVSLDTFADILGHEMGHQTQPGGYVPIGFDGEEGLIIPQPYTETGGLQDIRLTPFQYENLAMNSEGVAILSEFTVNSEISAAKNLPVPLAMPSGTAIQTALTSLQTTDAGNPAKFDTDAIAAAASLYALQSPSIAPNLTYAQYYLDQGVITATNAVTGAKIDWGNMSMSDLVVNQTAGGGWAATGIVPVLTPSVCKDVQVNYTSMGDGDWNNVFQGLDGQGLTLYTVSGGVTNGVASQTISGTGAAPTFSNVPINVLESSSASINGNHNTITLDSDDALALSGVYEAVISSLNNITFNAASSGTITGNQNTVNVTSNTVVTIVGNNEAVTGAIDDQLTVNGNETNVAIGTNSTITATGANEQVSASSSTVNLAGC